MAHDSIWEEALLADMEIRMAWIGRRDWKPGSALYGWGGDPVPIALYLVESGALEFTLDGERWTIKAGEAFFVPAGNARERIATTQGARWISLGMRLELYGQVNLAPAFEKPLCWRATPPLPAWFVAIAELWQEEATSAEALVKNLQPADMAARFVADALGKAIFGLCWPTLRATMVIRRLSGAPPWLWDILERIHRQPHLSLVELGQCVSISPAHLRRIFHRYLRQSPIAYLTERRLLAARHLLERTDQSVVMIATEVGFDSLSHFTRLYSERFGIPPARHRRQSREGNL